MAESSSDRVEKLSGAENWEVWKFSIQCLLGEKDYALEVVNGELTLPEAAAGPAAAAGGLNAEQRAVAANYLRGNRTAKAILTRSIEPKVLVSLMTSTTARQMWQRLEAIYDYDTALGGVILQTEFCEFAQEDGETLTDLIHRFEALLYRMHAKAIAPTYSFPGAPPTS